MEGRKLSNEEKDAVMRGDLESAGMAPKEEEKPAETQKEEIKETKDAEKETVQEKTEEEVKFDLAAFNKKFGKEFESEDAFSTLFEKAEKYDETKSSYEETAQKLTEYQSLTEKLDPMSNFLNEDEYKRQQLLIKQGDNLSKDAIKALSVLTPSEIDNLSDVDALTTQLMVDKGLSSKDAKDYLLHKYDISEFGTDDIEDGVKTTIKVDAIDAKREVSKLYDGIEVPSKTDYETARTQLKESWEKPIPELIKSIDKIQLDEGVDFVVTDEMKDGLTESTLNWVMSKQIAPSEEAGAELAGMIKDQILLKNIDKVIKSVKADLAEQVKSETRKEIHNDKPLSEDTRPGKEEISNDEKMSRILG